MGYFYSNSVINCKFSGVSPSLIMTIVYEILEQQIEVCNIPPHF